MERARWVWTITGMTRHPWRWRRRALAAYWRDLRRRAI